MKREIYLARFLFFETFTCRKRLRAGVLFALLDERGVMCV